MFQLFLGIIITFGLFRSMMIDGQCTGTNCDKDSTRSSRAARCASANCHHHHHHTSFCSDCGTTDCNVDRNNIGDNCWNCCNNRISSPQSENDNKHWEDDKTSVATECGSSSTDCNWKNLESDISGEKDEYSLSSTSNSVKTLSERESKCPPCPLPSSCPPPPPCPLTSNGQRFSRGSNNQLLNKNFTLPMFPEGIPIIPSPQLDMLTSGDSFKFANIQDRHLSKVTPSSDFNEKLSVQDSLLNDFLSNDCCKRCSDANCMTRNSNKIMFAANIHKSRRNRGTNCKNKYLGKLMITNIKRDPTRSKRAIQRAAEKKFAVRFNVICSKNDFSYVTHTTDYCEVFSRGTVCYAFKVC
ncbi:Nonribosomal peptide synthetase [Dirofilaria immitis]